MGLRIFMAGAMLATLGACDSGSGGNQAANDRGPTAAAPVVAAGNGPVDCTRLPEFVPLYGDARVETCVSGPAEPGHEAGTVIYTTGALPAAVIAWYKDKAKGEGLTEALSTPTMFSAREDGKRSVMAMAETVGGATKVTVNWGRNT